MALVLNKNWHNFRLHILVFKWSVIRDEIWAQKVAKRAFYAILRQAFPFFVLARFYCAPGRLYMNRVRYMLGMICMLLAYGFNFRTRAVFSCTADSVITIQVKQYARTRKTSLRGEYKIGPEFLAAVTLKVWRDLHEALFSQRQDKWRLFLQGNSMLTCDTSGQVNFSIRHRVYMCLSILKLTRYSWLLVMLSRTAPWDCVGGQVLIHFPTQSLNRWWKKR